MVFLVVVAWAADVNAKNKGGETPLHVAEQALALTKTTDEEKKKRLSEVIEYLTSKQ